MRLISEDNVMEMLTNIELSRTPIPMIEAKTRLRDIPTAYDLKAVEEQIRKHSYFMGIRENMVETIVSIVKKGGKNV